MKNTIILCLLIFFINSCGKKESDLTFSENKLSNKLPAEQDVNFNLVKSEILTPHCLRCHNDVGTEEGLGQWVTPGKPESSSFFLRVEDGSMPQGEAPLSTAQLEIIKNYIEQMVLTPTPTPTPQPPPTPTPTPDTVSFSELKTQILVPYGCTSCHSLGTESKLLKWMNLTNPTSSSLYTSVKNGSMPIGGQDLNSEDKAIVLKYIQDFARNN
jgi:mono/diheme cytochrome c family protein